MKKTKKMEESGFLDRAFENASFVPEDDDWFDEPSKADDRPLCYQVPSRETR